MTEGGGPRTEAGSQRTDFGYRMWEGYPWLNGLE